MCLFGAIIFLVQTKSWTNFASASCSEMIDDLAARYCFACLLFESKENKIIFFLLYPNHVATSSSSSFSSPRFQSLDSSLFSFLAPLLRCRLIIELFSFSFILLLFEHFALLQEIYPSRFDTFEKFNSNKWTSKKTSSSPCCHAKQKVNLLHTMNTNTTKQARIWENKQFTCSNCLYFTYPNYRFQTFKTTGF